MSIVAAAFVAGPAGAQETGPRAASETARIAADAVAQRANAARTEAKRTGERVELVDDRGPTTTTFVNPDGTRTTQLSITPVRVRRGVGWAAVDTTLVTRPDGSVAPRVAAMDYSFGGGGSSHMITAGRDGATVSLSAPATLPRPVLDGNTATYSDVFPGVDLRLTAQADHFSQYFVVKTPAAARDPRLARLRFGTQVSGGAKLVRHGSGGLVLRDAAGRPLLEAPAPAMWDSADRRSGSRQLPGRGPLAPVDGARQAEMPVEVTGSQLLLDTDDALLKAKADDFPVVIDPSLGMNSKSGWAMVDSAHASQEYWKWDGDEGVGYNNTTGSAMVKRLYFKWAMDPKLTGATIISANMRAYQTFQYSCDPATVYVYRTASISSATNWSNKPAVIGSALDSAKTSIGRTGCTPGGAWVSFNVKTGLVNALNAQAESVTFGLQAANETGNLWWKRFRKDVVIDVQYNHAPDVPTARTLVDPSAACATDSAAAPYLRASDQPSYKATVTDVDLSSTNAEKVKLQLQIMNWSPVDESTPIRDVTGSLVGAGTPVTLSVADLPAVAKGYKWRVRAIDGNGTAGSWSSYCYFRIDPTAPPPPTISLSGTSPYALNSTSTVTFSPPAGTTDIVSYKWAYNNTALTRTSTGTATVQHSSFGPGFVAAASVDQAGHVSSSYTRKDFTVGWDGKETDRWAMNEGTGTTAADKPEGATTPIAGRSLTLSGGATWGEGPFGWLDPADRSISFGGAGSAPSSVAVSTATNLIDTSQNATVMTWFRPDNITIGRTLLSQDGVSNRTFALDVFPRQVTDDTGETRTALKLQLVLDNPDQSKPDMILMHPTELTDKTWYHATAVYDASTNVATLVVMDELNLSPISVSMDVEGVDSQGRVFGFTPMAGSGVLRAGAKLSVGNIVGVWNGQVDDVTLFRGAVSTKPEDGQVLRFALRGLG